ncbi:hypothetical protein L6164_004877 [Bauhinia variegata]|uniref:Uncharacterized protein n=1 Tax=Bauhinia variegata TaxID=167791 RepID=A0ACB9PRG1_BAUVA|nr:hypothetical protein L6164_004877 [Bauhinia variegata]
MTVLNYWQSSSSGQEQLVQGSDSANGKRKMTCEVDISMPATPPKPQPKVTRFQKGSCYRCNQLGHWVRDCPSNKLLSTSTHPNANDCPYPNIHCKCGYGLCEPKKSKSGRYYYLCPIQRGKKCSFDWCDEVTQDRLDRPPPPYKYPQCREGICRKEIEKKGPNAGRFYFACPLEKGHGACGYHLWEEDFLQNCLSISLLHASSIGETYQANGPNDSELGDRADLHNRHSKVGKFMDNAQCCPSMALMEKGDHDEIAVCPITANSAGFPEFPDDPQDLEILNSAPWDTIEKNALLESGRRKVSAIRCLEGEFDNVFEGVSYDQSFIPTTGNILAGPSCAESDKLEQLKEGINEGTTSLEQVCKLEIKIECSPGLVPRLVTLLQTHLPNISSG